MAIESLFLENNTNVSHFSNKTNNNGSWLNNEENRKKNISEYALMVFTELVNDRKNYLNQLLSLPNNWISGQSDIPNKDSIEIGKNILSGLLMYLNRKMIKDEYVFIPKIIMGPIPSGGISIELHRNFEIALYFNIFNNKKIEIETKCFDYYSDIEIENINEGLLRLYDLFIEEPKRNSGWGNSISVFEPRRLS
jgi:hypothetical protein